MKTLNTIIRDSRADTKIIEKFYSSSGLLVELINNFLPRSQNYTLEVFPPNPKTFPLSSSKDIPWNWTLRVRYQVLNQEAIDKPLYTVPVNTYTLIDSVEKKELESFALLLAGKIVKQFYPFPSTLESVLSHYPNVKQW